MDKIKEIIKEYIGQAECGIFFTRNFVGDNMHTIYEDENYQVDICYGYEYFEVFGLNWEQQKEIEDYYYECCKEVA